MDIESSRAMLYTIVESTMPLSDWEQEFLLGVTKSIYNGKYISMILEMKLNEIHAKVIVHNQLERDGYV